MARWYSFAIARLAAHPNRDERLNVGLVVFDGEHLDVHAARNLDKVRAISAALDVEAVRASILRLSDLDKMLQAAEGQSAPAERLAALATISPLEFSELGQFESYSDASYKQSITQILGRLIEPEPAPMRKMARRSRLLSSLKAAFRTERVMARKGEDLSAHRVVAGWPLAEGLSADFLLKNGAMHIIETVDAQSDDISVRKLVSDIAVSALVLERARMTFGESQTTGRLVYSASAHNESLAKPSLLAAEHQGAQLINWASHDDRLRLISDISGLATPLEKKGNISSINASVQQRLQLN